MGFNEHDAIGGISCDTIVQTSLGVKLFSKLTTEDILIGPDGSKRKIVELGPSKLTSNVGWIRFIKFNAYYLQNKTNYDDDKAPGWKPLRERDGEDPGLNDVLHKQEIIESSDLKEFVRDGFHGKRYYTVSFESNYMFPIKPFPRTSKSYELQRRNDRGGITLIYTRKCKKHTVTKDTFDALGINDFLVNKHLVDRFNKFLNSSDDCGAIRMVCFILPDALNEDTLEKLSAGLCDRVLDPYFVSEEDAKDNGLVENVTLDQLRNTCLFQKFQEKLEKNTQIDFRKENFGRYARCYRLFSGIIYPGLYKREDVPIPPYLLGYWLGDGQKTAPLVTVGKGDVKVFREYINTTLSAYVRSQPNIPFEELKFTEHAFKDQVTGEMSGVNFYFANDGYFIKSLRKMNLYDNKHIPDEYLYNEDTSVLYELVAGAIDSDGSKDVDHLNGIPTYSFCQEVTKRNFNLFLDYIQILDHLKIPLHYSFTRYPDYNNETYSVKGKLRITKGLDGISNACLYKRKQMSKEQLMMSSTILQKPDESFHSKPIIQISPKLESNLNSSEKDQCLVRRIRVECLEKGHHEDAVGNIDSQRFILGNGMVMNSSPVLPLQL